MKATILLADAAQEDGFGKVHALGLGWTQVGTPTAAMAVIILLDVGWDETNRDIEVNLSLLDADGGAVSTQTQLGQQPISIQATTQAGRPPGLKRGSEIRLPLTVTVGENLPLEPDQRYEWRLTVNGEHRPEWSAAFHTAPQQ